METYKGLSIVAAAIILSYWYKKTIYKRTRYTYKYSEIFYLSEFSLDGHYGFGLIGLVHVVSCYGQNML